MKETSTNFKEPIGVVYTEESTKGTQIWDLIGFFTLDFCFEIIAFLIKLWNSLCDYKNYVLKLDSPVVGSREHKSARVLSAANTDSQSGEENPIKQVIDDGNQDIVSKKSETVVENEVHGETGESDDNDGEVIASKRLSNSGMQNVVSCIFQSLSSIILVAYPYCQKCNDCLSSYLRFELRVRYILCRFWCFK